jgi:5'(3')-deoxyribonucleotidase
MADGRIIGVDIDGVLADQVSGVLERVNARDGSSHAYDDIVEWNFQFDRSDFVTEIRAAMKDRAYVLGMPVHSGAVDMVNTLNNDYAVQILTVRPPEAIPWTIEWLDKHGFRYAELAAAREALKSHHGADALIDDYEGNIAEFLEKADGPAILVNQPWNQDVSELAGWISRRRLFRVGGLSEVSACLARALRSGPGGRRGAVALPAPNLRAAR